MGSNPPKHEASGPSIDKLVGAGLIATERFKFKGEPTVHVRLLEENFTARLEEVLKNPSSNPYFSEKMGQTLPKDEVDITETANSDLPIEPSPYTESTSESTSEMLLDLASISAKSDATKTALKASYENTVFPLPDEIDEAIAEAWQTRAPGIINDIRRTLLGLHSTHSLHFASNVQPSATAEEIRELKAYFEHQNPNGFMPKAPAKIQDWVYKVRALIPSHVTHKGHLVPLQIKVPPEIDSTRKAMQYVNRFYPEEAERLGYLFERIDEEKPPRREMNINPIYPAWGEKVHINVPVPADLPDWQAVIDYLYSVYPEEGERVDQILEDIGNRREQEFEAITS